MHKLKQIIVIASTTFRASTKAAIMVLAGLGYSTWVMTTVAAALIVYGGTAFYTYLSKEAGTPGGPQYDPLAPSAQMDDTTQVVTALNGGTPLLPPDEDLGNDCEYTTPPRTSARLDDENLQYYPHLLNRIVVRLQGSSEEHYIPVNQTRLESDLMLLPGSLVKVNSLLGADVFEFQAPPHSYDSSIWTAEGPLDPIISFTALELARMISLAFVRSQDRMKKDGGCGYAVIEPAWKHTLAGTWTFSNDTPARDAQWSLGLGFGAHFTSDPNRKLGAWELFANYMKEGKGRVAPISVAVVDSGFPYAPAWKNPYSREFDMRSMQNRIMPCTSTPANIEDIRCHHGRNVASVIGASNEPSSLMAGALGIGTPDWPLSVQAVELEGDDSTSAILAWRYAAGYAIYDSKKKLKITNAKPAKIINFSAGGDYPCAILQQEAIDLLARQGVILVAAAGNKRPSGNTYPEASPASCDGVISVTAHGIDGKRNLTAYPGSKKSISAPGIDVLTEDSENLDGQISVKLVSGTSSATSLVATTVLIMRSIHPSMSAHEVQKILSDTATKNIGSGPSRHPAMNSGAAVQAVISKYKPDNSAKE